VPRRLTPFALLALLAAAAPAPAGAKQAQPTPAQIGAAVLKAERSHDLWATVNICDSKRAPNTMGIRGQMPALGFKTELSMLIRLEYYRFKQRRWSPVPGVMKVVPLGSFSSGLHQDGFSFSLIPPPVFTFRGAVTFKWTLAGKVVGSADRRTAADIKHVDRGDPPGYSRARCTIQ
jgi:hypothetical protein